MKKSDITGTFQKQAMLPVKLTNRCTLFNLQIDQLRQQQLFFPSLSAQVYINNREDSAPVQTRVTIV